MTRRGEHVYETLIYQTSIQPKRNQTKANEAHNPSLPPKRPKPKLTNPNNQIIDCQTRKQNIPKNEHSKQKQKTDHQTKSTSPLAGLSKTPTTTTRLRHVLSCESQLDSMLHVEFGTPKGGRWSPFFLMVCTFWMLPSSLLGF